MDNNNITIKTDQVTELDLSYQQKDAVLIRFMNFGQNYVSLDDGNVIIQPGEAFTEGDLNGPGIDHSYKIEFIANPGAPPAVDGITVKGDNFINVRIFKRTAHARK